MSDHEDLAAAVADNDLPTTLRLLRAALGFTRRGFCSMLGVSQQRTLRAWESGTWRPGQMHAPWPKLQRWAALVSTAADGAEEALEVLRVAREKWGDQRYAPVPSAGDAAVAVEPADPEEVAARAERSRQGVELRRARLQCGLSQADVARLAGVSVAAMSRWERGVGAGRGRGIPDAVWAAVEVER